MRDLHPDLHRTHLVLIFPGDQVRPSRWCRTCGRLVLGEFLGVTPAGRARCGRYAEQGVDGRHHALWDRS